MKVAIIIPTMNRSNFILRQLRFYELMKSPHPVYISDSSNEENAEKIKNGIKKFKNFEIIYQWVPPGKDCMHQLLPLVKEKYCIQMGDDDIMIPKTISECAEFLEEHPDYATCAGKQVNVRLRIEDYNKPHGFIARETRPFGRAFEQNDIVERVRDFWSEPNFICFSVTRTEIEIKIRNVTKNFYLLEHLLEFFLWSTLIVSGKSKIINKLGYMMQISDNRYDFTHNLMINYIMAPSTSEKWSIIENELVRILEDQGKTKEESLKLAKWIFTLYLSRQFSQEAGSHADIVSKIHIISKTNPYKKARNFIAKYRWIKKIFHKFRFLTNDTDSELLQDISTLKAFLERPAN